MHCNGSLVGCLTISSFAFAYYLQCNSTLEEIRRETQAMSLFSHPNVVPSYGSFVTGQHLWVIMPYLSGGSFANIMKACYVEGLDENIICIVIREVLQALEYIHRNGSIHRDVKAGNILVDDRGNIQLADVGVTAVNFGDRTKVRPTHSTHMASSSSLSYNIDDFYVRYGSRGKHS